MKHIIDGEEEGIFIMDEHQSSMIHHVYPVDEIHNTSIPVGDRIECDCGPHHYMLCSQCDGDDDDCWRCGGEGVLPIAFDDGVLPRIIVHNRRDE